MKKITLLALHLGYGGGEKAIINLANYLSLKFDVEIISVYKLYEKPAFLVNDRVKVRYLINEIPNKDKFIKALKNMHLLSLFKEGIYAMKVLYKRQKYMKSAIKKCDSDVIISSRVLFNSWLGKNKNSEIIKVAWEHNHHNNNNNFIKKLINSCRGINYLVCVSPSLSNFYSEKISNCKVVFIPNMIERNNDVSLVNNKNIVFVGRLEKEKALIDLIDVFNDVLKDNPDCILNIVGDGSQRELIKQSILQYGICDNVIFHGWRDTEYINNLLLEQSIFVMTSYQESFGIVLIEAMNKGIPCIAFDSALGPREIICDGVNGYLIKDRNKYEMSNKIGRLLNDNVLRMNMSKKAYEKGKEYEPKYIVKQWESLFTPSKE